MWLGIYSELPREICYVTMVIDSDFGNIVYFISFNFKFKDYVLTNMIFNKSNEIQRFIYITSLFMQ